MEIESQEEDLERPCAKNPLFQSTGQETKARPPRGLTGGAGRVRAREETERADSEQQTGQGVEASCSCPAGGGGSPRPTMPGWLSLPSGPHAIFFSGLTMFSQVSVGDLHLTVSWEK